VDLLSSRDDLFHLTTTPNALAVPQLTFVDTRCFSHLSTARPAALKAHWTTASGRYVTITAVWAFHFRVFL